MNTAQQKTAKLARSGFLSLILQGDVAGLTTYTTKRRRTVAYPQAPPKEPVTPDQSVFRATFAAAIQAWRSMSHDQQQQWRLACKRGSLRLGPTALVVAAAFPQNISSIRTLERQTATNLLQPDNSIAL